MEMTCKTVWKGGIFQFSCTMHNLYRKGILRQRMFDKSASFLKAVQRPSTPPAFGTKFIVHLGSKVNIHLYFHSIYGSRISFLCYILLYTPLSDKWVFCHEALRYKHIKRHAVCPFRLHGQLRLTDREYSGIFFLEENEISATTFAEN
jgi:hypothetical protein